ncbi:deoxycytidylate deaminase [Parasteatoda tepidariorum]|uniref:deoxycytidylate deaminase n=1 Tax=Parasteatoda tepidariorum TaxID=114398 RepID=UPI0039BC9C80
MKAKTLLIMASDVSREFLHCFQCIPEVCSCKLPNSEDARFNSKEDSQDLFDEKNLTNEFKASVQIGNDLPRENENDIEFKVPPVPDRDENYLPWHDYFMSLCYLTSARSKDPKTKMSKSTGNFLTLSEAIEKYSADVCTIFSVCHAEMNAIINNRYCDFKDCTLYVTKFPCSECAKLIVQAGLKAVFYDEKKPEPEHETIPGMRMFKLAGIQCSKFIPSIRQLCLDIVGNEKNVTIIK